MLYLRKSTASQVHTLGPLVGTDGVTPYTTALANTEIKIAKAGGTTLTSKNSGGSTHISNGVHYCTFDATDSNTLGSCAIYIIATGVLIQRIPCVVMQENVYDALIAGIEFLETHPGIFAAGTGAQTLLKERDGTTTQRTMNHTTNASGEPITGGSYA